MKMKLELVDTHAHLDLLEGEVEIYLRDAAHAGVNLVAAVGINLEASRKAVEYSEKFEGVDAIVGIHPHEASTVDRRTMDRLRELACNPGVVGIGETGLDFYRNRSPRADQERSFRWHVELAKEMSLAVVVHDRDAHAETIKILEEYAPFRDKLVLHCFSGDLAMARECMEMGGYISVAGPITFLNAKRLRELVAQLPLERLLLETDCPFLSPHPYRGKPNFPARVALIAQCVAELKGVTLKEVAEITTRNWLTVKGGD